MDEVLNDYDFYGEDLSDADFNQATDQTNTNWAGISALSDTTE